MVFRSYDSLHVFTIVAKHESFSAASEELNLTKGAVSYQIGQVEQALGVKLFDRTRRGVSLTEKGQKLQKEASKLFSSFEKEITELTTTEDLAVTVATSTYFASRWLSPRLMNFLISHPNIRLRIQPLVDLVDLQKEKVDLAIRWGNGEWNDMEIERLFPCTAVLTAGAEIANKIDEQGLENLLPNLTLLHDREESEAWADWHEAADFPYERTQNNLTIPDPNVRVQAVIDGQGIAINDDLVRDEIEKGSLFPISSVSMSNYGYYLAYREGALENEALESFRSWIMEEARIYRQNTN